MCLAMAGLSVALAIAFLASWKLTLAVLVFVPLLLVAGYVYGECINGSAKTTMDTTEQGGKVGGWNIVTRNN